MLSERTALELHQKVDAPASAVYQAFTNATALREWLCDLATVHPRRGGRFYLWWNSGYFTSGSYTELKPGEEVAFTWRGEGDPGESLVRVAIAPDDGGAMVSLQHEGLGEGEAWDEARREIERGWETGLENLASVLESGRDLRILRRPMLGITVGDFDAEVAKKLDVPVSEGIRLDGLVEGMGAEAAGLKADDVMVRIGDKAVTDWGSLGAALQAHQAGDNVEVEYYREGKKQAITMVLSGRPVPDIPDTARGLADAVKEQYDQGIVQVEEAMKGATDEQASRKPAPGEWSALEVLAHLIRSERGTQAWIEELLGDEERWSDGFTGNMQAPIDALVAVYPTVEEMLDAGRDAAQETIELLAALPDDFVARKRSYWRLAFNLLQNPIHLQAHIDQIKAALNGETP